MLNTKVLSLLTYAFILRNILKKVKILKGLITKMITIPTAITPWNDDTPDM